MSIVPGRDVPEVPQEWVDAVNEAVNDANHDDLCACHLWPDACPCVAAMHATGQCPCNSVPRAVSDAPAAVETHLVDPEHRPSRAWLLWSPGGSLADITEYEQPVTLAHAQQRHDDDADLPAGTMDPIPDTALPAVKAAWQQAIDQGRTITRDDLKGILP